MSKAVKIIFSPNSSNIQKEFIRITDNAKKRICELMAKKKDAIGLNISVKTRGCNGLSYYLEYAYKEQPNALKIKVNGSSLFIDPKAQFTILGSEMDYEESRLSSQFVFKNPNIKGTCGCGESFNL